MELNQRGEISCQLGAWFPELFCNFNSVKNHKIVKKKKNQQPEKKSTYLEFFECLKNFDELT
jgi:hypothetical protein